MRPHLAYPTLEEVMENFPELTAREMQIFLLAGYGLTNVEIGEECFISPFTVREHMKRIHSKLDIKGRGRLAVAASRVMNEYDGR